MSYLTQLQTNNTNLQACIDKANALPEAGSGGGTSGTTDYCNITITSDYSTSSAAFYLGESGWDIAFPNDVMYENNRVAWKVACGSVIAVYQNGFYEASVSNGEIINSQSGTGFIYQVPTDPDSSIAIDIITD